MVTDLNEIIRSNMVRGDEEQYLDFWRMMSNPENMEIIGDEFQKKIKEAYDITAAIDDKGLVLSTIIGRRIGVGMCNAFSKYFPDGAFTYYILPKDVVKDKNVLLTTGEIADWYKQLQGANRIIFNGGKPKTIATLIDYDKRFKLFRQEKSAKEIISKHLQRDIDVISLIKESDLGL